MFDIQKMMKQAQKIQKDMAEAQEALGKEEITGSAGGGAVVILADGKGEIKAVTIKPEATEDLETLQDLVLAAIKDAQAKASDLAQQRMGSVTQGLNIPGLPF